MVEFSSCLSMFMYIILIFLLRLNVNNDLNIIFNCICQFYENSS